MSSWQFSKDGYVINGSPTAERDADRITLFDNDGCVVISADYHEDSGWHVCASDFYQWIDFTTRYAPGAQTAIYNMFLNVDHKHQASGTSLFRMWDGRKITNCDLCGVTCAMSDMED